MDIHTLIATCPHQVSRCHQDKLLQLDHSLQHGIPFPTLGGKRLRCRPKLVRFKIGREWRVIYSITSAGPQVYSLVIRQCFERELKRRRAIKPA